MHTAYRCLNADDAALCPSGKHPRSVDSHLLSQPSSWLSRINRFLIDIYVADIVHHKAGTSVPQLRLALLGDNVQ